MRMRMMLMGGALLMATGGCATTRSDETQDSRTAWQKTKDGFGTAYNGQDRRQGSGARRRVGARKEKRATA